MLFTHLFESRQNICPVCGQTPCNCTTLAEGSYARHDGVGFSVDSERAYNAVMSRFGDVIDYDEDSGIMYAPEHIWPKIEMVAFDADGIGATPLDDIENPEHYGVDEGHLHNPGQEDSPVAQAIIRRILMQRTDLLAKYGPGYVGQAVDDVADSVGDWDEIGSSDVSGWVRQVEWNLKNKLNQYDEPINVGDALDEQGVAEGYPKHQDLSGISTDKLKAYLDKQSKQQVSGEGNQVKRVRAELQRRQQGVAEGFADEFAKFAQERGGKLRTGPQPTKPATVPAAHPAEPIDRAALEQELKQLSAQLDPNYEYSDDYSFWSKQKAISDRIAGIKKKLGVTEGDISQLEKDIAAAPVEPIANMEADEKIAGRHDADDFDSMVNRLKKLAGAGPLKTVYDPQTRRYKNVPTAVQPKK